MILTGYLTTQSRPPSTPRPTPGRRARPTGRDADPMSATAPRLVGINHVALEVGELEAALEFYGAIFELRGVDREPGMAFIDMGDQFLALSQGRSQPPTRRDTSVSSSTTSRRSVPPCEAQGVEILPGPRLDFLDPWGNQVQIVDYRDIQFTKAPPVIRGMGLEHLRKRASATQELRAKGLT